jgi:hypothetical protein
MTKLNMWATGKRRKFKGAVQFSMVGLAIDRTPGPVRPVLPGSLIERETQKYGLNSPHCISYLSLAHGARCRYPSAERNRLQDPESLATHTSCPCCTPQAAKPTG